MTTQRATKRRKGQLESKRTHKGTDNRALIDTVGDRAERAGAALARKFIASLEKELGIAGH